MENENKENENTQREEYSPRIYLLRSSLKPIEVPLSWNIADYHVLDEIERFEKEDKRISLEKKFSN